MTFQLEYPMLNLQREKVRKRKLVKDNKKNVVILKHCSKHKHMEVVLRNIITVMP